MEVIPPALWAEMASQLVSSCNPFLGRAYPSPLPPSQDPQPSAPRRAATSECHFLGCSNRFFFHIASALYFLFVDKSSTPKSNEINQNQPSVHRPCKPAFPFVIRLFLKAFYFKRANTRTLVIKKS